MCPARVTTRPRADWPHDTVAPLTHRPRCRSTPVALAPAAGRRTADPPPCTTGCTVVAAPAATGWGQLQRLARAQEGAFALRQATSYGIAATSVHRRIRQEEFQEPFSGVAVLPGFATSGLTVAFAAALSIGPEAVLTGRSALAHCGLLSAAGLRPLIVLDHGIRRVAPDGVRLRRSRTLVDGDWVCRGEVRVASPGRAIIDAAPALGRDSLRRLLIDGRQRELLSVPELAQRVASTPQLPGRRRLLQACEDVLGSGADSPLVAEVEVWLRREGFQLDVPPRTVQTPSRILHPDITLAGLPVGLEVDGFGYHSKRAALDLDQRKHNAYVLAGWVVLRIGWDRFRSDGAGFLAELRAAVAQAEAAVGSASSERG